MTFAWDARNTKQLHDGIANGLSASQIAREIGAPTRNVVIGKMFRLGIRSKKAKAILTPRAPPQLNGRIRNPTRIIARMNGTDPGALASETAVAPRTILELDGCQCRWPVDGEGASTLFCAALTATAVAPYCAHHTRRSSARYAQTYQQEGKDDGVLSTA